MGRTNYLGTAHLTHRLLPLLQETGAKKDDARVVNVVSKIHARGSSEALFDPQTSYNSWKFYGLSKLALIHFSNEMNRRFAKTHNLQAYSLHPGGKSGTYTNVATRGFEGRRYYVDCEIGEASLASGDKLAAGRLWTETRDWIDSLPAVSLVATHPSG